ncbi:hypothetical protein E3N88_14680 [Mikania micrantha]|uniref:Uncharacterized protein n=1 Tax=Mikania micrantha TaxID=192012 RepID=A0A5N6P240_9ASTR|nr:hypothetical protein E3N88_14680 [Mikania micrantha]
MSSSDEMEIADDDVGQPHVDDLDVEHFDELRDHPWLAFPQGTSARRRRDRLLKKEMGNQKAIDYDLLAELGQQERMTAIIGEDTPWSRLFEMTYAPQYRLIMVEFLSTFRFTPQPPDFQPQPGQAQQVEVSFRLCGAVYHLSLAEFGSVLGLYTEEETHMPIYTTERGLIFGGVYVTRIARFNGLIDLEPAGMKAFHPVHLDRRTVLGMRIAQTFPRLRLRFSLVRGVVSLWLKRPVVATTGRMSGGRGVELKFWGV